MADKRLFEVRKEFVERVSSGVLSQLLDDLLEKGVLNEEEVENVRVISSKQGKARVLIDKGRNKGPKASLIFIECINCRDSYLADNLGLQAFLSGQSSETSPLAPTNQVSQPLAVAAPSKATPLQETEPLESRHGITLCPLALFQKIQAEEPGEIYPILDSKTRTRLALIICNINFDHHSNRDGAEVDLEQMQLLLEGLGYQVQRETNLCSQGMAQCLQRFAARKEHETSDSTFLVLMTHGLRNGLCGVKSQDGDSDILPIDRIYSLFNNVNCKALRGKPKVIIIQACRGVNRGCVLVSDSAASSTDCHGPDKWSPEELASDAIQRVHVESDLICLHSSTPDNVAWRHPQTGSLFLVELRNQIQKHAWKYDLEEIFRKVQLSFEKTRYQMPTKDRATLMRKFYLFPGL